MFFLLSLFLEVERYFHTDEQGLLSKNAIKRKKRKNQNSMIPVSLTSYPWNFGFYLNIHSHQRHAPL